MQTLADIRERNPVILPRELWEQWIDPTVVGDRGLVDEAVAPLRGDGPQFIEPITGHTEG